MPDEDNYRPGNPDLAASGLAFVLTGCSGGGKSTLIGELALRGFPVVPEAGRQIVREQASLGGDALPWENATKFVELAASRTMHSFNAAKADGRPLFFDRSLVDLISFLNLKNLPVPRYLSRAPETYRFASPVFVTPPWLEIYVNEAERSKTFEEACREYDALLQSYRASGYAMIEVPKMDVGARADFIVSQLPAGPEHVSRKREPVSG